MSGSPVWRLKATSTRIIKITKIPTEDKLPEANRRKQHSALTLCLLSISIHGESSINNVKNITQNLLRASASHHGSLQNVNRTFIMHYHYPVYLEVAYSFSPYKSFIWHVTSDYCSWEPQSSNFSWKLWVKHKWDTIGQGLKNSATFCYWCLTILKNPSISIDLFVSRAWYVDVFSAASNYSRLSCASKLLTAIIVPLFFVIFKILLGIDSF